MRKLLLGLFLAIPGLFNGQVVINELNADNPGGPDTQEFLELYGPSNASLDSLVLVFYDGNSGTSYNAIDLDGYTLDAFGFFVVGNANTANVDLVINNASIQNGQDGVVLYFADATDFPNGTAPVQTDLLDAMVYGTGDPTATNLITGLGLDVLMPGYTQLDETVQQNGTDLTLSRIPDGGTPFDYASVVLQALTPGTFNLPPCNAGAVSLLDPLETGQYCDNASLIVVEVVADDATTYGDGVFFALTDGTGNILSTSNTNTFDLTGFAVGAYRIYAVAFSGVLDETTIQAGAAIAGVTADVCASVSSAYLNVAINACGGCIGGEVTDADANTAYAICNGDYSIAMATTSTSLDDEYLYVLADTNGVIIDTFADTIFTAALPVGSYQVWGVSYVGTLDESTIAAGLPATGISASTCASLSTTFYSLMVYQCVPVEDCTELFFSEYLESTGSTKALEIFNPTLQTVDLTGYSVLTYNNGATAPVSTLNLTGTLAPYSTYVIVVPAGGGPGGQVDANVAALANTTSAVANYNGNDAIELRHNDLAIDVIGVVGQDPGNNVGWTVGNGTTVNSDLVRKYIVRSPITEWAVSAYQWDVFLANDFSHIGSHSFNSCSNEVLIGFSTSGVSVNENGQTITVTVNAYNVTSPITVNVNVTGGTATVATDYTTTNPGSFTFDGSTTSQTFTITIINDTDPENTEDVVFTLDASGTFTWINQVYTLNILANDPNCNGGFLGQGGPGGGNNTFNQCSDLPNTPLTFNYNTNQPAANYVFVLTTATDTILQIFTTLPLDLDSYPAGTYHVHGLSYTGALDETTTGEGLPVNGIAADTCASISQNFITVIRDACIITGCDAGTVLLNDSTSYISVCDDGEADILSFINTGASTDDSYTYFLTTADSLIVSQVNGTFDAETLQQGIYMVWGISYQGTLQASPGQPITGIFATTCAIWTSNTVMINVYDCSGVDNCSNLFFSEYLEGQGSNRALEIFNPTTTTIDLSAYAVNIYANGATTPVTIQLSGELAPQDVYVLTGVGQGPNQVDAAITAVADTIDQQVNYNGNDAIELTQNGVAIDVIGVVGEDPGNQQGWALGVLSTRNFDLVRRPTVSNPSSDWSIVSGQWIGYALNDFSHLGAHSYSGCLGANTVGFTVNAVEVNENVGTVTLTVQAFGITEAMDFNIETAGSATLNGDYSISATVLSFDPQNQVRQVTISVVDDAIVESQETVLLTLTTSGNIVWTNNQCLVRINDNDGISVSEVAAAETKIYPNPANDAFTIQSAANVESWKLYDLTGRVVAQKTGLRTNQVRVDVSNLRSGTYFVEVNSEAGMMRKKLIVE